MERHDVVLTRTIHHNSILFIGLDSGLRLTSDPIDNIGADHHQQPWQEDLPADDNAMVDSVKLHVDL